MTILDLFYHAASLFIIALAILVVLNSVRERNNWTFFFWSIGAAGWIEFLWWGFYYAELQEWVTALIFFHLSYAFSVFGISMMMRFYYFFPRVIKPIKLFYRIAYLVASVFVVSVSFTELVLKDIVVENGVYVNDIFGPVYPFFMGYVLFSYGFSLYIAVKKLLVSRGVEKKKLALVTLGNFTFLFLAMIPNLILPIFGVIDLYWQRLAPLFALVFALPTFFALRRYRFFNVSNVLLNILRQFIVYGITLITVVLSYFALTFFLNPGVIPGVLSSLLALLVFRLGERKMPQLLATSLKQFEGNLTEFKSKVYFCRNYKEMESLAEQYFLLELNFVNARIYIVRKSKDGLDLPIYRENEFTRQLSKYIKDVLTFDEIDFRRISLKTKHIFKREMKKMNADLCIPLFLEGNLIGIFFLRQKNDDEAYSSEMLNILASVKRDLEIGLMNVLLKMNLQEENNLMKSIIHKKTKQLKNKVNEVNELLRQQSDFIAVTAHEFRTPLSIASFQMEDLLSSKKDLNKHKEELHTVEQSINSLKQLTEKLFAIQQYDLNKVQLNLEKIDLKSFIEKTFKEFVPIMKIKDIQFSLNSNLKKKLVAKIDPLQIRQVMHNILKNASKFTSKGGQIRLSLETLGKESVLIQVSDSGEGIPDSLKESIFEKFRTESAGSGIGLGLYLCKKIIELHKGKLWVEDSEWGGANFKIQLKLPQK